MTHALSLNSPPTLEGEIEGRHAAGWEWHLVEALREHRRVALCDHHSNRLSDFASPSRQQMMQAIAWFAALMEFQKRPHWKIIVIGQYFTLLDFFPLLRRYYSLPVERSRGQTSINFSHGRIYGKPPDPEQICGTVGWDVHYAMIDMREQDVWLAAEMTMTDKSMVMASNPHPDKLSWFDEILSL